MPKRIGTWLFSVFCLGSLGGRAGKPIFACEKVVFLLSLLYVGNKVAIYFHLSCLNAKIGRWQVGNS